MLQVSTGFTARIFGPETWEAIMNGGYGRIFSGSRPNTANDPETQNGAILVGILTKNGYPAGFPQGYLTYQRFGAQIINPPTDAWMLTAYVNTGIDWFRLVANPNDAGGTSYTEARFDGDIGVTESTAELIVPSTTLSQKQVVGPLSFYYTTPPSV